MRSGSPGGQHRHPDAGGAGRPFGLRGCDCLAVPAPDALAAGLTPVPLKEVACQATAYLGLGGPSLCAHNGALFKEGIPLPLPGQSTTAAETRREAGTQVQVDIFGEGMADFWRSGPEESRHIDRWLAANCFGDYCTRTGSDLRQRELIAFRFLAAQGGCEPQPKSHIAATLRLGTGQRALTAAPSTTLPYIGYPRSLNALRCIQEADPKNSCPTKREGRTTRGSFGLPLAFGPFCHISGAKARRQARPSFLGQGTLRQSSRVISWHSSRVRRNSSLI